MKNKLFFLILIILTITVFFWNSRTSEIPIDALKTYALNCQPCEAELSNASLRDSGLVCSQPPFPSDEVLKVINKRTIDDEYKKWILLVYLKLYEKQLILYNQGFEVRESPFLIERFTNESALSRAFCEVLGNGIYEKKLGPEFLPAYAAYEYIDKHRIFMQDTVIQKQMTTIESILADKITKRN